MTGIHIRLKVCTFVDGTSNEANHEFMVSAIPGLEGCGMPLSQFHNNSSTHDYNNAHQDKSSHD